MDVRSRRPDTARGPLIKRAVAGTFADTGVLVDVLVRESLQRPCWRPVRAAAVMAMATAEVGDDHVWMRTEEFVAWVQQFFKTRRTIGQIEVVLGVKHWRRTKMLEGARISKVEALACAHHAAGLPQPIDPITSETLEAWFMPRFGAVENVAKALAMKPENLIYWMRGYEVVGGQRRARSPGPGLVRALDWLWRVGPYSPYGDRPPAVAFPGQEVSS